MVSEDSDQLGPGFLSDHCRNDLNEIGQAGTRKVHSTLHPFDAVPEIVEVRPLRSPKGIFLEERNNHVPHVRALAHFEPMKALVMVVITCVGVDGSNPEVRLLS